MAIRVMSGRAYVDLDPALQQWVDKAVRQAAPETVSRLEQSGDKLYDDAKAEWPVKTGRSRDALFRFVRLRDLSRIELVVGCEADYSFYIMEPWPSTKKIWIRLLKTPVRKEYEKLSTELVEELATKLKP